VEGQQIERLVTDEIERISPDVLFIGRESFAEHAVPLARENALPSILRFAGATTLGILNGTYPEPHATGLLERFRQADVAVTSAQHMRASPLGLRIPSVEVIPIPVAIHRFGAARGAALRRELGIQDDQVVVAHVSNLKALKRALDFVDAAAIASLEDDRLAFLVVGDGPGRAELERACRERGIAD